MNADPDVARLLAAIERDCPHLSEQHRHDIVGQVQRDGLHGTYRISGCFYISLDSLTAEPCPGVDAVVDNPTNYADHLVRCACGSLSRVYFDGVQWRCHRHDRPLADA